MASIEHLPSGKKLVRYRDPSGRSRRKTVRTITEAKHLAATIEADMNRGTWTDPRLGRVSFRGFAEEYMAGRHNLRSASRARDESLLRNHLVPFFDATPMARITRASVQKWVVSEIDKGYSPRTIRESYRVLAGVMGEAVEARLILESPCRKVSLPRPERVERRFLSPTEVECLVAVFAPRHQALLYGAVYLGPRWEELAGLKRKNLDLLRRQVKIVATIERSAGTYRYVEENEVLREPTHAAPSAVHGRGPSAPP